MSKRKQMGVIEIRHADPEREREAEIWRENLLVKHQHEQKLRVLNAVEAADIADTTKFDLVTALERCPDGDFEDILTVSPYERPSSGLYGLIAELRGTWISVDRMSKVLQRHGHRNLACVVLLLEDGKFNGSGK